MVTAAEFEPEPEPDIGGHPPTPTREYLLHGKTRIETIGTLETKTQDHNRAGDDWNCSNTTDQLTGLSSHAKNHGANDSADQPNRSTSDSKAAIDNDDHKEKEHDAVHFAQDVPDLTRKEATLPSISTSGDSVPVGVHSHAHHREGAHGVAEESAHSANAEPTIKQSLVNTLRSIPYIAAIPILLPVSWALHFSHQSPVAVFITSLLTIVPIAGGLSFATEELAMRIGEAWGGLLNATFGNAVELLIAILALVDGEIDIVQASMIGSILSNVLLVLGMSYFAGGLRFHEQNYAIVGAQMHISLLGISLMAIVLPAAFHFAFPDTQAVVNQVLRPGVMPEGEELDNLLKMSRGLSFILLAVYGMFLTFQLYTHAYLFRIPREPNVHPLPGPKPTHEHVFPRPHWVPSIADSDSTSTTSSTTTGGPLRRIRQWSAKARSHSDVSKVVAMPVPSRDLTLDPAIPHPHPGSNDMESQSAQPAKSRPATKHKITFWYAIALLTSMTALAGVTAEWLVDSIDGLTAEGHVSREFVGLILLPVIGNSVEHITAVTVSVKDKLNLSMSIAVGSSIQVSLCILPILVLVGWAIGQPMILFFDTFETITLVISILLVNFAISDGRTNYLEGFIMMMAYVSIALVCWFYNPV